MNTIDRADTAFVAVVNSVDLQTLQDTVWVNGIITTLFFGVRSKTDNETGVITYGFIFDAVISGAEETELDVIIAAHTGTVDAPSALVVAIDSAIDIVDMSAGEARDRYSTTTLGQDLVYAEKHDDAKRYKEASYPADETGYQFVTAEKNAKTVSSTVAADGILAGNTTWKDIAASIEELRIDYKDQIAVAADVQTAQALGYKCKALLNAI